MTKKDLIPGLLLASLVSVMVYAMITCITRPPLVQHCNHPNKEYAFDVTDDSIFVYTEDDKFVGGVKLQGQLDSLIFMDNQ